MKFILNYPQIFAVFSYRKNFIGTKKRVRINHGKRPIENVKKKKKKLKNKTIR